MNSLPQSRIFRLGAPVQAQDDHEDHIGSGGDGDPDRNLRLPAECHNPDEQRRTRPQIPSEQEARENAIPEVGAVEGKRRGNSLRSRSIPNAGNAE